MKQRYLSNSAKIKTRGVFLFYMVAVSFLIIMLRLSHIQVFNSKGYQALAKQQYNDEIIIQPKRGSILDQNGNPLAESLTASSVIANPHLIKNPALTAKILSAILKQTPQTLEKKLSQNSYFVWLARKVAEADTEHIKQLQIPGIEIIIEPTGRRFYPKGKLASPLIGYTGLDDQGLAGIEYYYDKELKGSPGKIQLELDALGRPIPEGKWELSSVADGANLATTIDETIQYVAEKELANTIKETNAASGTVIVMNPKNGDILAMANMFAPEKESNSTNNIAMKNPALSDAYEPGSTFKTVAITAALDSGKIKTTDRFYSGSSITVGGRTIHNADDGLTSPTGYENASEVLTYSFNVGAISIGQKMGAKTFYNYLEKFDFMKPTGIDLPGEGENIIPPLSEWTPLQLATISFGHGIAVTPLKLLRLYGAIANGGYLVTPHIGKALVDKKGEVLKFIPFPPPKRVLSEETAKQMQIMLHKVVEEGTGKKARVPGYAVGGKTGTAQVVENGAYISGKYVASFVGFVPVEDPVFVILVKIDEPQTMIWGGAVAGPVFNKVAQEALWYLRTPTSHINDETSLNKTIGGKKTN